MAMDEKYVYEDPYADLPVQSKAIRHNVKPRHFSQEIPKPQTESKSWKFDFFHKTTFFKQ